jgi:hypothetical protein
MRVTGLHIRRDYSNPEKLRNKYIRGNPDRYRKRSTSTVFYEGVGSIYQVVLVCYVADGGTDMTELICGFETPYQNAWLYIDKMILFHVLKWF